MFKKIAAVGAVAIGLALVPTGVADAKEGCTGTAGQPINSAVCTNPENKPRPSKGSKNPTTEDLVWCGVGFVTGNPLVAASTCLGSLAWE